MTEPRATGPTISWKDHVDQQIECLKEQLTERDKRYQERFEAQERALLAALETAKEYRTQANEWRGAMLDREKTFVQVSTYDARHLQLDQKIDEIAKRLNEVKEKYVLQTTYDARHKVVEETLSILKESRDKGTGIGIGWSYLLGFFGLIASIAAVVAVIWGLTRSH